MTPELTSRYIEPEPQLISYKLLQLISPENAQALGIPAEAPVFVSPMTRQEEACHHCGVNFTPLVYQTGYETVSQHMHDDRGGIYHFSSEQYQDAIKIEKADIVFNWIAEIEPQGNIYTDTTTTLIAFSRSNSIKVLRIRAFCASTPLKNYLRDELIAHETAEGFLLPKGKSAVQRRESLEPVCLEHVSTRATRQFTAWKFHINEVGEVSFSRNTP